MEKRCRICEKKKDVHEFQTWYNPKSGMREFTSLCLDCEVKDCPCCRKETKFLVNGKPQEVKKLRFFRRNSERHKVWGNGWVCSHCQYIVTEKNHEDNNDRASYLRA